MYCPVDCCGVDWRMGCSVSTVAIGAEILTLSYELTGLNRTFGFRRERKGLWSLSQLQIDCVLGCGLGLSDSQGPWELVVM